ncbi:MAG: squalene/phytoene synthase family protein [Candidatus Dojkabacteria bacterium]|nr:MAG: squalene/phytoene synthase family protein [Candidatus Dojkabacteria bacterium]
MKNTLLTLFTKDPQYTLARLFLTKKEIQDLTTTLDFFEMAEVLAESGTEKEFQAFKSDYDTGYKYKSIQNISAKHESIAKFILLQNEYGFDQSWADSFFAALETRRLKGKYIAFSDVENYLRGIADTQGFIMHRIITKTNNGEKALQYLSRALQYFSFIRSVGRNSAAQSYFALADLEKRHLNSLDHKEIQHDEENFIKFIRDQIARYLGWNDIAMDEQNSLPLRLRIPLRAVSELHEWTAQQIWENPMVLYQTDIIPSPALTLFTFAKSVFSSGNS